MTKNNSSSPDTSILIGQTSLKDCRDILENAPIGIFTTTPEGRYIFVNPALARMYGYDKPEKLISSVTDIASQVYVDPADRDDFIRQLESSQEAFNHECRMRRLDGTILWVSRNARLVRNEKGNITHYQGFTTDVSEKKQAEAELREKTRRLNSITENMFDMVSVTDLHGNYKYLGPSHGILGYDLDAMVGRNVLELVHPDDYQMVASAFAEFLANREDGRKVEYRYRRADGDYLWFETVGKFIPDKDGNPKEILFSTRDFTERKKAEETLREREAFIKATLDNLPVGVAVNSVDPKVKFTYMNDNFAKFYRTTREELAPPADFWEVVYQEPEFREKIKKKVLEDCAGNDPERMNWKDVPVHRPGQEPFYITAKNIPLPDSNLMLSTVWDVTDRKLTEDALVSAKVQAEAANQAKSEFLANMSHEIRTPINGIMGMMQLLQLGELNREQKEYVDLSITSAKRLTRLLSDILDLSRVEAGKMTIHETEFEFQELGDSVSDLFKVTARDKGVTLKCSIDPQIPSRLIGDEARVRQILFNLVGNALKFTKQGTVQVETIFMASDQEDGCKVLFTVSDTGIGISDDKLVSLFKPFVQVDGSHTRKYQGAGLGLSIVKRLVDLMGGKISVASTVGQGTTVYVLLPFRLPEGEKSIPVERPGQLTEAGQSLRILLAEDESSNAIPTKKLLEKAGHTVTLAEDGQQVLDLLQNHDFDCILMDIHMPVMDGVEATRRIRAQEVRGQNSEVGDRASGIGDRGSDLRSSAFRLKPSDHTSPGETTQTGPRLHGVNISESQDSSIPASRHSSINNPRIPIIALTAYAMLGDREKFLEAGMDDYLAKPVTVEDFQRVLEKI